jgi:hypothetical protein
VNGRPHLSISQIGQYERCPRQWYFRNVLGLKTPPGVAQVIGVGTHGGIDVDVRQKMEWGVALEAGEVKDAASDATNQEWAKRQPVLQEGDPDQGQAVDMAVSLASAYHDKIVPLVEPIGVEVAFLIELPQLTHDFVGVMDLDTPTMIRDTKTAGKRPQANAATRSMQMTAYHLHSTLAGHPGKGVALDFILKGPRPSVVTLTATPTADDHAAFVKRVELTSAAIDTGIYPPTDPSNWACSAKWCGYYREVCEFGARKQVTVGLIDPKSLTTRLIPRPHQEPEEEPAA